jgi:hypothetical protein
VFGTDVAIYNGIRKKLKYEIGGEQNARIRNGNYEYYNQRWRL